MLKYEYVLKTEILTLDPWNINIQMKKPNFNQQLDDGIVISIANTIDAEVERYRNEERVPGNIDGSNLLSSCENIIRTHIPNLKLRKETSLRLRESILSAIDAIPALNNMAIGSILNIFHTLFSEYIRTKTPDNVPVLPISFMLNLGITNDKYSSERQAHILHSTLDYTNTRTDDHFKLRFAAHFFDEFEPGNQGVWLSSLIQAKLNSSLGYKVGSWLRENFKELVIHALASENKDFGFELMMFTLKCENDPRVGQPLGNRLEIIELANQIRAFICGDLDTFKRNLQIAESLDCSNDRDYWKSMIVDTTRSLDIEPPLQIEI